MAQGNELQSCPQWYCDRLFHFTSSEVEKLLKVPKNKDDREAGKLSASAESYIFDKLAEILTNGTCLDYTAIDTREVRWGNEHEQDARMEYERRMGNAVELCGFIPYNSVFGGSPDGLVGEDGIIEIKCPYNSANHARNLLIRTESDFRKLHPTYYAQIQGNLLATGRKWADFVSYDVRMQNAALMLKVVRIERNEEYINQIIEALTKATAIKNAYMAQIVAQMQMLPQ